MSIGFGVVLVAVGAILAFAVNDPIEAVDLTTIGYILMGAGAVITLIGLVLALRPNNSVSQVTRQAPGHEPVVERRETRSDDPRI